MPAPPIFIVGSGRSGTTLLYELLCGHPDLAWISNITDRFPQSRIAPTLNRLAPPGPSADSRLAIRPSEGYRAFDWALPRFTGAASPALRKTHLTEPDRVRLHALAYRHVRGMSAERFINKNTRNTRRLAFLDAAFPDAQFIHVLRHPHSAVASMLRVDFWSTLETWNQPSHSRASTSSDHGAAAAARLWRDEVEEARRAAQSLTARSSRYLEVRYEDLVQDSRASLTHLVEFLDLPGSAAFERHVNRFHLADRNKGVENRLTPSQMHAISTVVDQLATEIGYHA